jgi:hypothetical protein
MPSAPLMLTFLCGNCLFNWGPQSPPMVQQQAVRTVMQSAPQMQVQTIQVLSTVQLLVGNRPQ